MDENRLKRCLQGVIRCEGWISTLRGLVGFDLMSQGCVTVQTFVEIEETSFLSFFSLFFEDLRSPNTLTRSSIERL